MKVTTLLVCLVLVFAIGPMSLPGKADKTPSRWVKNKSDYPEVLEYTYNYTFDYDVITLETTFQPFNHTSGSVEKTFPTTNDFRLRDVTTVSVYCWINAYRVDNVTITASLNGYQAMNHYFMTGIEYKQNLLFILDNSYSMVPPPINHFNLSVAVGFSKKQAYDYKQVFWLCIFGLTIRTAFRQNFGDLTQLNETNSHITALIINPTYDIMTSDVYFNKTWYSMSNYDYTLDFLVIMPYQIEYYQKSCYLNITFSYTYEVRIWQIALEHFALISTTTHLYSVNYLFRYVPGKTGSVARGFIKINPKTNGYYHIKVNGQLYIANEPVRIFPDSKEMELFLFTNVSIVIPGVLLSKLIYKRLKI